MKISENPRIEMFSETQLVGRRGTMSVVRNTTPSLWQGFMPYSHQIPNRIGSDLYSVEVYEGPDYFHTFDPEREFEKWAAVSVQDIGPLPEGMELLTIPKGQYAVFQYRGRASQAHKAYQYIYGNWVPGSEYELDDRPHFAVMGTAYNGEHPDSEEEIWIPIKS